MAAFAVGAGALLAGYGYKCYKEMDTTVSNSEVFDRSAHPRQAILDVKTRGDKHFWTEPTVRRALLPKFLSLSPSFINPLFLSRMRPLLLFLRRELPLLLLSLSWKPSRPPERATEIPVLWSLVISR